ncbi:unnamed protein product [Microthlaspi erraticum]|uniref:Uncharacterized protein n=1 Tax=Microthlaspi erraticum TaxID=1685480 RepID=A0A6D2JKT2_9BRAS|nr:unnamed protein product [Microthlaspi erraticum]
MDFIKTSSLRALIELTFQRNWNGLIWMSRKGVIQKVKTVQTALSRNSANRERLAEERMFRVGQSPNTSVPPNHGRSRTDPGTMSRGRPSHNHSRCRARSRREEVRLAAATTHVPRPIVRSGKPSHAPAEKSSAKSSSADHSGRPRTIGHDRSDRAATMTRCPADRPDRPSQRRGRPEARFEARFTYFQGPA